jgi:hypothetical protein
VRRLAQCLARRYQIVGHLTTVTNLAAETFEQTRQQEAVRIVDRPCRQRLTRHAQFVAGEQHGHSQAAENRQLRDPHRCRQGRILGPQALSGGENLAAGGDVTAGAPDVVARFRQMVDQHRVARVFAQLLHHHRVRTGRDRRAGEDSRRASRLQRRTDTTGRNPLRNRQTRLRTQGTSTTASA